MMVSKGLCNQNLANWLLITGDDKCFELCGRFHVYQPDLLTDGISLSRLCEQYLVRTFG